MAMGAEVEINTIPGYLPQRNDRQMGELFGGNVKALFGAGSFDIGGHRTGSTDMGDIAHMTAIDLLYGDAAPAKKILAEFKPVMTKDGYLAFERGLFRTERYKPDAST
jgi:metal-dependent amidase/aminoacylase/carboxypeptidase family protein